MEGAVCLLRYVLYSACLSGGSYLANSERSVPGRTWGSLFLFWFSSSSAVVWRGLAHRFISFRSCKSHNTHDVQLHLQLPLMFLFFFFFSFLFFWGELLGFKTHIWTGNGTQVGKPTQYECLHACFLQSTLNMY